MALDRQNWWQRLRARLVREQSAGRQPGILGVTSQDNIGQLTRALEDDTHLYKTAQEKCNSLEQRIKQLEHLAETLAHDMKGPGQRMEALSSLVLKKYGAGLDDEVQRLLRLIHENGKELTDRVETMLELARVRSLSQSVEAVNPAVALDDVLKVYAAELTESQIRVETAFDMLLVPCHRSYLRQIFDNLISNAVKSLRGTTAPRIRIVASRREDMVYISVSDTGPGIPVKYREQVFEPFVCLSPGPSKNSGIGLTIVKRIVEWHGGQIWIEAERPGCTVTFTLPYLGTLTAVPESVRRAANTAEDQAPGISVAELREHD